MTTIGLFTLYICALILTGIIIWYIYDFVYDYIYLKWRAHKANKLAIKTSSLRVKDVKTCCRDFSLTKEELVTLLWDQFVIEAEDPQVYAKYKNLAKLYKGTYIPFNFSYKIAPSKHQESHPFILIH